jgi:hypothetical protein
VGIGEITDMHVVANAGAVVKVSARATVRSKASPEKLPSTTQPPFPTPPFLKQAQAAASRPSAFRAALFR